MAHTYLAHGPYFKLNLTPLIPSIIQLYLVAYNVLDLFLCCASWHCIYFMLFCLASAPLSFRGVIAYPSNSFLNFSSSSFHQKYTAQQRCSSLTPPASVFRDTPCHGPLLSQDFFDLLVLQAGRGFFVVVVLNCILYISLIIVSDLTLPSFSYLVCKMQRVNQNNL